VQSAFPVNESEHPWPPYTCIEKITRKHCLATAKDMRRLNLTCEDNPTYNILMNHKTWNLTALKWKLYHMPYPPEATFQTKNYPQEEPTIRLQLILKKSS